MEQKTRIFCQIDGQEFHLWPMPPLPPFLMYYLRNACPLSLYHHFLVIFGRLFAPTLSLSMPFKQFVDKKFDFSAPYSVSSSAGFAFFARPFFCKSDSTRLRCCYITVDFATTTVHSKSVLANIVEFPN
jgi:hypothetical protein